MEITELHGAEAWLMWDMAVYATDLALMLPAPTLDGKRVPGERNQGDAL